MLIAFEGIDGSGKGTQARLLLEWLSSLGVSATVISFPRYTETFYGKLVGRFLNGEFGRLNEVHPLLAAVLYAEDRNESTGVLQDAMLNSSVVILDRYVGSNLAHQGAKYLTTSELNQPTEDLMRQIVELEYRLNVLPKPDLTILLEVPIETALKRIASKPARAYTTKSADIHEADSLYLTRVAQLYRYLAIGNVDGCCWATVSVGESVPPREVSTAVQQLVTQNAFPRTPHDKVSH